MLTIVKYTLKQTVFINVLFVILVVAGAFSLLTSSTENMPMVDMGEVFIHTVYYGASADDVEQLVTRKIEDATDSMENVEYVQSNSYRNFSSVKVKFIDDSNYRHLYDELRFCVLNIKDELPVGVDDPEFLWIDTNVWMPVIAVNISGDLPLLSLERYAQELRALLLNIPDVRDIDMSGDPETEFHLSLDPEKLRRYGVTFMQVVQAVEAEGVKIPTGRFRTGNTSFMLDAGRRLKSQDDVLNVIVRRDGDGTYLRVRDLVTSARQHYRDPRVITSVNGKRSIRLEVLKEINGDSIAISRQIRAKAVEFGKMHANEGLKIFFTNDSAIEINDSIHVLSGNLILGLGLVIIVLWLTLGFRNSMLTAIGIPFSFLCTLIIMKINGVTVNTISIFSFVLVTGIIVDDAVIIIENTFRHLHMGKSRRQAVIDGTSEVMLPVISSAVTTVLAFVPMLIMTGSTGDFFAIIPKTVSFALMASLLEALFILPIHIFEWGPKYAEKSVKVEDENTPFDHLQKGIFAYFWQFYRRLLGLILNHKVLTLIITNSIFFLALAILLLSMFGIMPLIKVKFFPGNYFRYHVTMQTSTDTAIERTSAIIYDISRYIMSLGTGQADSAAGFAGFYEDIDYARHSGPNYGQVIVTLPEKSERNFPDNPKNDPMQHLTYMRNRINAYVAQNYGSDPAQPNIQVFAENDGPPSGKAVNVRLQALTIDDAISASDKILNFMRKDKDLSDLIDLTDNRPTLYQTFKFLPRQEAVYEYDLTAAQITALLAGGLNGRYAGTFRTRDEEVDLLVRIARTDDPVGIVRNGLKEPGDVLNVPVIEDSAAPVYLRDLVSARLVHEPNMRTRYNGKPTITISSDIRPGSKLSSAQTRQKVQEYFKKNAHDFPEVTVSFGGEFESTNKSYASLGIAFLIAVLGIYMVLASQFRDYFQPLIILTAVPFAVIGVAFGAFFTRTVFTIGSFIATVGLSGVAVNNTILMIDFMNKRLRAGKDLRTAVMESCAARMRPVLITTVTTILGLLPMAVGIPSKSISWAPMANAFVTGLSSATILALLITPANYELLHQMRTGIRRRRFRSLRKKNSRKSYKTKVEVDSERSVILIKYD
jgi:HAE1 family hydrophobic/amphiphilic exporter-1